jgi:hypothetical protein
MSARLKTIELQSLSGLTKRVYKGTCFDVTCTTYERDTYKSEEWGRVKFKHLPADMANCEIKKLKAAGWKRA